MKAAIVFCISIGICAAADSKPAARPTEIPASAVETAPGSYVFTDAGGVRWLLRKTPFGVAAVEERLVDFVRATDAGDSVRFVQASPFGSHTWLRKKTELTESESEVWERQRDRSAGK